MGGTENPGGIYDGEKTPRAPCAICAKIGVVARSSLLTAELRADVERELSSGVGSRSWRSAPASVAGRSPAGSLPGRSRAGNSLPRRSRRRRSMPTRSPSSYDVPSRVSSRRSSKPVGAAPGKPPRGCSSGPRRRAGRDRRRVLRDRERRSRTTRSPRSTSWLAAVLAVLVGNPSRKEAAAMLAGCGIPRHRRTTGRVSRFSRHPATICYFTFTQPYMLNSAKWGVKLHRTR